MINNKWGPTAESTNSCQWVLHGNRYQVNFFYLIKTKEKIIFSTLEFLKTYRNQKASTRQNLEPPENRDYWIQKANQSENRNHLVNFKMTIVANIPESTSAGVTDNAFSTTCWLSTGAEIVTKIIPCHTISILGSMKLGFHNNFCFFPDSV